MCRLAFNSPPVTLTPIHMIVPVSGRLQTLKRLLNNFDCVILRANDSDLTNVYLHIVLMETAEDSGERMPALADYITQFIATSNQPSRIHLIKVENGTYAWLRTFLWCELFPRILIHTIFNKQVYFPIIFSQYDPQYWETNKSFSTFSSFQLRDDIGYWRQYGFGMLSIYKADLGQIGNWNVEISGWGKEDVEIYDKLVQSPKLTVFRTIDTSLMHIFHTKECLSNLRDDQMNMCKGTKSITLGTQRILVRHVQKMIELNRI